MNELCASVIREEYGEGWDLDEPKFYLGKPHNQADSTTTGLIAVFPNIKHPLDRNMASMLSVEKSDGHYLLVMTHASKSLRQMEELPVERAAELDPHLHAMATKYGCPVAGWFRNPIDYQPVVSLRSWYNFGPWGLQNGSQDWTDPQPEVGAGPEREPEVMAANVSWKGIAKRLANNILVGGVDSIENAKDAELLAEHFDDAGRPIPEVWKEPENRPDGGPSDE